MILFIFPVPKYVPDSIECMFIIIPFVEFFWSPDLVDVCIPCYYFQHKEMIIFL